MTRPAPMADGTLVARVTLTDAETRTLGRLERRAQRGFPAESRYSMAPNVIRNCYRLERRGLVEYRAGKSCFALTEQGAAALRARDAGGA